jgi:hypothetical protein
MRWWAATVALFLLAADATGRAAPRNAREYEVKAAYLYAFSKFVQWPTDEAGSPDSFRICVAGVDPFGGALDEMLRDTTGPRRMQQRHVASAAEGRDCHILFLSDSLQPEIRDQLAALDGSQALTIGEMPQFVNSGGMIQFVNQRGRVRFEINLAAAQGAGLTLAADLLRVASAVRTGR